MNPTQNDKRDRRERLPMDRVEAVLRQMHVDIEAFFKIWAAFPDPHGARRRAPTPEEIDAVKQFVEDGNVGVLMKRIGTTNRTAVNGLVTRVAGYLARIGRAEPPSPRKRPKLLGVPKVHAVLEHMGRTADEFTAIHTTLPAKQARVTIQPSATELGAVEEFLKTGDANALRAKLTRKDRGYLNALVTRVLAWKARQVHQA